MSKPEFTLTIRYRLPNNTQIHKRRIPWNWRPTADDAFNAVRRLRGQYEKVEVLGVTLTREVLIQRFNIKNPE